MNGTGRFLGAITASVQFLSRLPVHRLPLTGPLASGAVTDFSKTAHGFALAGIIIAAPSAFILWLCVQAGLPHLVCATLAVAALVFTTGALHEDGLADLFDGFWGGHTKERKLAIMRDSSIGTYGTLALVFSSFLRVSLLSALLTATGAADATMLLLAVGGLSRFAMLPVWTVLPAARRPLEDEITTEDKSAAGLSARYGSATGATTIKGAVFALPAAALVVLFTGVGSLFVSLLALAVSVAVIITLARHHIGGHTGDVLGATQQVAELALLLALLFAI